MRKISQITLIILVLTLHYTRIFAIKQKYDAAELIFNKSETIEYSNLSNINKMFEEMKIETSDKDYYYVIIGDTQNLIRSYDWSGFNQIAKNIIYAKDKEEKEYVYEKIKFVIHLGDFVFEGYKKEQWDNLKKVFSRKDYYENNYPYIKLLFKDKPLFPVIGNHELMKLRLKNETKHRDFASTNEGLEHFSDFFNWEGFFANSNIIYSIPARLSQNHFTSMCNQLNQDDIKTLNENYVLLNDGKYYLKIFQNFTKEDQSYLSVSNDKLKSFNQLEKEVIASLHPIYLKLGYNTLPVLSSDNFINYAFEVNNHVFLVMDSMARGWHYKVFSNLKNNFYNKKSEQHYLNLFSANNLNGQYNFFNEIQKYVKRNNMKLSIYMHHTAIDGSYDIDRNGLEYNHKLMLGIDYDKNLFDKESLLEFNPNIGNNTFFDEIMFFNEDLEDPILQNLFTACIHYFQNMKINSYKDKKKTSSFNWITSSGAGGNLVDSYDIEKVRFTEKLYNSRLKSKSSSIANKSIRISDYVARSDFHFLLVHVRDNEIVDVIPKFIDQEEVRLKKNLFNFGVKLKNPYFYKPYSVGTQVSLTLGSWGLEKFRDGLQFITYEPSFEYGFIFMDMGKDNIASDVASISQLNFLNFKFTFAEKKHFSILFAGLSTFNGGEKRFREFLTYGIEAPLIYNFFGVFESFSLGINHYISLGTKSGYDKNFVKKISFSVHTSLNF